MGHREVVGPDEVLTEFDDRLERVTSDSNATGMCGAPITEWHHDVLIEPRVAKSILAPQRGRRPAVDPENIEFIR